MDKQITLEQETETFVIAGYELIDNGRTEEEDF